MVCLYIQMKSALKLQIAMRKTQIAIRRATGLDQIWTALTNSNAIDPNWTEKYLDSDLHRLFDDRLVTFTAQVNSSLHNITNTIKDN